MKALTKLLTAGMVLTVGTMGGSATAPANSTNQTHTVNQTQQYQNQNQTPRYQSQNSASYTGDFCEYNSENLFTESFVKAIGNIESRQNPYAISPKGALGEYQVMPTTWTQYRKNLNGVFNPNTNRKVALEHLGWIEKYCEINCPYWENLNAAQKRAEIAASYNGGHFRLKQNGWRIDSNLPAETRLYIDSLINELGDNQISIPDMTKIPRVKNSYQNPKA